ncbi:hypothetical protein HB834_06130 [Listeria booriae]|uniref:hypothetical protein n=1 Tax=Listeria booriae TaxID=1552123 RepID=UPI00164D7B14|nr:hypothetical protein [Listeria booriae]MBC6151030.1 hypothetical protein [Listeria booriae]MBC6151221.1 hypothetical protein [Listeria booriae]
MKLVKATILTLATVSMICISIVGLNSTTTKAATTTSYDNNLTSSLITTMSIDIHN